MNLLPIRIEVQHLLHDRGKEKTYIALSQHTLQINAYHKTLILNLINEKITEIVKDFDLSHHYDCSTSTIPKEEK